MPSSFCQVAVHIIFGLRSRDRFLNDEFHPYIHGIITSVKGHPIIINSTEDHVHILCYLPKDMSVADFVRTIKSNSSKWHNSKHMGRINWQTGYAAYSVSKTNIDSVKTYIQNQKQHHRSISFAGEMEKYLSDDFGKMVYDEWFREENDRNG